MQGLFLIYECYQLDQVDLGENIPIDEPEVGLCFDRSDERHKDVHRDVCSQLLSLGNRISFDGTLHEGVEATEGIEEQKVGILSF